LVRGYARDVEYALSSAHEKSLRWEATWMKEDFTCPKPEELRIAASVDYANFTAPTNMWCCARLRVRGQPIELLVNGTFTQGFKAWEIRAPRQTVISSLET